MKARRKWWYRLANESLAREITFSRRVTKDYVLRFLSTHHKQLTVEIWEKN